MTALIATITDKGVLAPTYSEVLTELQKKFRAIYGQDINLDNDTADGQWLGIVASAINDANAALTASYTGYAPSTASGTALSSIVRTNGHQPEQSQFFQRRSAMCGAGGVDHFRRGCRGRQWQPMEIAGHSRYSSTRGNHGHGYLYEGRRHRRLAGIGDKNHDANAGLANGFQSGSCRSRAGG